MRTFNLEMAKAGEPVVARKGNQVRIICFDHKTKGHGGPIIGLVLGKSGVHEMITQYNLDGTQVDRVFELDLLMKNEYESPEETTTEKSPLTAAEEEAYNTVNSESNEEA